MEKLISSSVILLLIFFCQCVNAVDRPRGVSLEKAHFYSGPEFKCLSDGKKMPLDHVNDDYCDCEDGSDEPGTSACNNGLFYCENKAFKGSYILTSRVNDGICDCCDGSDEYDGTITCENSCEKLFAEVKAQMEAFRQKQEAGYKVKQEYIQQGHRARDEKISRLQDIEKDKEMLNVEKNDLQAAKEAAEAPEKEAKDRHQAAWDEEKARIQKEKDDANAEVAFRALDVNQDNIVDYPEMMKHPEFDIDSDGTVSEEEAKEYLEEAEEANLEKFVEKIWPSIKEIYKPAVPEGEEGAPEGGDGEEGVDGDVKEGSEEGQEEDEKMPDYDEDTNRLIRAADDARQKFDDVDRKVRDVDKEIEDIKKYLELDFGPHMEFAALKGQCFELTDREYTYKLCPFDKTSQKPKDGGIETSLGKWGHWYGPEEDKYDAMKYENGQGCWNGPARSCHVNLHCGSENALTGASEPSRCEYQFEFTTPARCAAPEEVPRHEVHEEL